MENFYSRLTVHDEFEAIADAGVYVPAPNTWSVVIADVKGATRAIQQGLYRDVNLIGASIIASILNIDRKFELPYVFGGDSATLLVPNGWIRPVSDALLATRRLAREQFSLELRIGIVPIDRLHSAGVGIRVAKIRVSKDCTQAAFVGAGLHLADKLVKDPVTGPVYAVQGSEAAATADYTGLECRWQEVRNPRGETHTWLIEAFGGSPGEINDNYRKILAQVREIYGELSEQNPIWSKALKTAIRFQKLVGETKVRAGHLVWKQRFKYLLGLWVSGWLGRWYFTRQSKTFGVDWSSYQREVGTNADFRKFDEVLRMVLAGSSVQRTRLQEYLEGLRAAGKVAYGLHTSQHALLTSLVFSRQGNHIHFVDGANGGYALAAREIKRQLADRRDTVAVRSESPIPQMDAAKAA